MPFSTNFERAGVHYNKGVDTGWGQCPKCKSRNVKPLSDTVRKCNQCGEWFNRRKK